VTLWSHTTPWLACDTKMRKTVEWHYELLRIIIVSRMTIWAVARTGARPVARHSSYCHSWHYDDSQQFIVSRMTLRWSHGSTRASCVTYEWVTSHLITSRHTWMDHGKYEWREAWSYAWVVSRMGESCHMWMSRVTYGWVTSHVNSNTSHMNVSCYTCAGGAVDTDNL